MNTTLHKSISRGLLSVAVALLLGTGIANAGKPGPVDAANCTYFGSSSNACTSELGTLCAAIEGAGSLKPRDRDTMVSKTIGADIKLEQDKILEADAKLYKIELKLDSLVNAPKPKIIGGDANAISAALTAAQTCVDGL